MKKNEEHTEETKEKISKALVGNSNAEKYTITEATDLMNKALDLSYDLEYDFIGEILKELKVYPQFINYLIDKFPELKPVHEHLLYNIQTNCFYNAKKNKINTAIAIVNLKSNYKWTDRNDVTSADKEIKPSTTIINLGQGIEPTE